MVYKNKRIDTERITCGSSNEHTYPPYPSLQSLIPKLYHPIPKLKNENAANIATHIVCSLPSFFHFAYRS